MIIHFKKPSDWRGAYLYYWDAVPGVRHVSSWPGEKMAPEGDGWHCHKLKGQRAAKIVFSDGDSSQTADLLWRKPEGWFADGEFWDFNPEILQRFTFPGGKHKALVMSFDDGSKQDRRLIDVFNAHGIKGTFHINSGLTEGVGKIHSASIAKVYTGHEVSGHSVTHPFLDQLDAEQLRKEILADKDALEALVGYPVRGLSYPFGIYNPALDRLLPEWGLIYGRMVEETGDFRLPGNLLQWRPSCHHFGALELAKRFIADTRKGLGLLFVWGHSWEINDHQPASNWGYMEELCGLVGHHDDIWYAGAGDVAEYLGAIRSVKFSSDGGSVQNLSSLPVSVKKGSAIVELAPRQSLDLRA